VLGAIGALLLLGACGSDVPAAFADGRARWDESRPEDYSFTYGRGAQCGDGEMRIIVRAGEVADYDRPAGFCGPLEPETVDGLFDLLEAAYERADVVEASHDPDFGYPAMVSVDEDSRMFDEEWRIWITDFVVE
jgi:uncharacterized protein DUF6174